jgi:hypothetical protein
MNRKYNFAIGNHSECCWAVIKDNKCSGCGATIHHTLSTNGHVGKYIQAFVGMYRDSDEKKVRLKALGKYYRAVKAVKSFRGHNINEVQALLKCTAKYGVTGPRRYRAYHTEHKAILTFNAETGRTFSTIIYGKHKTVIDCSYGSNHLRDVIGKYPLKDVLKWVHACIEERKTVLPHSSYQLDLAMQNFPAEELLEQHRALQEKTKSINKQITLPPDVASPDNVLQKIIAADTLIQLVMKYDLVDELRKVFMVLHFPNLINTNMPLTQRFFDYN